MDLSTKQKIMEEIEKRAINYKQLSSIQYKIRCPICGDSSKDPKDAHCYIKSSFDVNEPILYNCFLCNSKGMVNRNFLEILGCKQEIVDAVTTQRFNRINAYKKADINIITGDPILNSKQADYVRYRLGDIPKDIWENLKIVWDLNSVYPYITNKRTLNSMPNNRDSISFLSDDKSTLLTRYIGNNEFDRWKKIHLFSSDTRAMYSIKGIFDVFTSDLSDLCIAEGVMDIISVYINEEMSYNSAYVAILGSDYVTGIDYAISKGIFGKNIRVHIYIDEGINQEKLKNQLVRYKWLYHSIEICKNMKYRDMGITPNKIKVSRRKV